MQDIILSPHFQLKEFIESTTARRYGIDNSPPPEVVQNLKQLCKYTLEPLRKVMVMPIIITSGYRCKTLNRHITHHSTRSQHMTGQAADFVVKGHTEITENTEIPGLSARELLIRAFRTIILDERIAFDQLIIYPSFIHVSYVSSGKNRRKITKGYGNGKYCALTRDEALSLC